MSSVNKSANLCFDRFFPLPTAEILFFCKKNCGCVLDQLNTVTYKCWKSVPFWRKGVDNDTFHLFLSDAGLLCLSGGSFLWT